MPETGFGTVLADVDSWYEPAPDLIEKLSMELNAALPLSAAGEPVPVQRKPRGRWLGGLVAAGLAAVLGVALVMQQDALGPETGSVPTEPVAAAAPAAAVPISINGACGRLAFSGVTVQSGNRVVSYALERGVSVALLFDLREALGEIADAYGRSQAPNPVMQSGISTAIGELGLATLYLQMGETGEAERHLETARATLKGLTSDSFFAACFGV